MDNIEEFTSKWTLMGCTAMNFKRKPGELRSLALKGSKSDQHISYLLIDLNDMWRMKKHHKELIDLC